MTDGQFMTLYAIAGLVVLWVAIWWVLQWR
jgi:hypothetical protein